MSTTAKIGAFTLCVLVALGVLVMKIEDLTFGSRARSVTAEIHFADVAGLDDRSAVRIAGVRVGKVDGIRLLPDGSAVAQLALDREVELREGAYGQIRNLGLLGDKYVELFPGPLGGTRLAQGARIEGSVPTGFDELTKLAKEIGTDVKSLTGALSSSLGGEAGAQKIDRIVDNVGALAEALKRLVESNQENVTVTLANLKEFSGAVRETLARLDRILDENRLGVKSSVENIDELTGKLKTSADNLNSITRKIDTGEGTFGKLLNDDETHKNLNEALGSIKSGVDELHTTLTRINRIKLELGFISEYMPRDSTFRGAFRVDVSPRQGKFYRFEAVSLPYGRRYHDRQSTVVTPNDGPPYTISTDTVRYEDEWGFSAQLGYSLDKTTLRAGLFESRGGMALDYNVLKDRVWLTGEVFDFSRSGDNPNVKLFGQWQSKGSLFLRAGIDDLISQEHRSIFVGAGVVWTDEDIKTLLPAAGALVN